MQLLETSNRRTETGYFGFPRGAGIVKWLDWLDDPSWCKATIVNNALEVSDRCIPGLVVSHNE
jgi:hypothetical protein